MQRSGRHRAVPVHGSYARHVGRIGALAVALGVGAAVATATGAGVAHADDSDSTADTSSSPNPSSTDNPTGPSAAAPAESPSAEATDASQATQPPSAPKMNYRSSGGIRPLDESEDRPTGTVSARTVVQKRDPLSKPVRPTAAEEQQSTVGVEPVMVTRTVTTEIAPPELPDPEEPAPSPLLWTVLGWTRREVQREPLAADVENQPPHVESATYTVEYGKALEIRVLESAVDPDGDAMWITDISKPGYGEAREYPEGSITYTPHLIDGDKMVTDKFSYTVTDSAGNSSTATVVVNIRAPEKAPVAVADTAVTPVDTPVTIDVLKNDDDSNGLKLTSAGKPLHGTVVITSTGQLTYTPNAGFSGVDSFDYTVVDGFGVAHVGTVTVEVQSRGGVGNPDSTYAVGRDTTLTVSVGNGLRDPKYRDWTVHLEEKPANGTLQLNTDGSFTYVPNKGFVGQDTFVYFVSQGRQGDGPFVAVINVVDGEVVQPAEPEAEAPSYAVTIALSSAIAGTTGCRGRTARVRSTWAACTRRRDARRPSAVAQPVAFGFSGGQRPSTAANSKCQISLA